MLKKTSLLLSFLALAVMAPMASAAPHWSIGLRGGMGLPMGDFADEAQLWAKSGMIVGLDVDYQLNDMFTIGFDGSWMENKSGIEGATVTDDPAPGDVLTFDKATFTTIPYLVHGKYWFPMKDSKFHPYGALGLGMYSVKTKLEVSGTEFGVPFTGTGEDSQSQFGGKLGLGGEWMTSEVFGVGIDANYHYVTMDEETTGLSSISFVDVAAAVHYHFKSK